MKNLILLFSLFFLVSGIGKLSAQVKIMQDSTYIFEMKDGNTYMGKVNIVEKDEIYEVTTNIGVLMLRQENIVLIKKVSPENLQKGEYWPTNPHSSRYFFSPSGYGLRKGEGYYQNAWILFNQVSYGFSDYFTMGVGTIPIFLLGVREALPFWITPKVNIPYKNGKGAFGAGSILFGALGGEDTEGVGILYGTNTFGTRDKQLTLGLGLGYSTEEGFSDYPVINVSGLVRTGKHWAFVTENYLFTFEGPAGIISGGARYMGKRMAIDMGGFIPLFEDVDRIIILPWLSISIPFGKRY